MFRKRIIMGMFLCALLYVIHGTTVYAGDINAEEQRVINYYNKTFYYNGKAYVATESAKSAAYGKLAQDGVDLTAAQADSMILQLSGNVANGIKQGYLVEVVSESDSSENTESNDQTNSENGTNEENNTNSNSSNQIENSNKNGDSASSADPDASGDDSVSKDDENPKDDTDILNEKKVDTNKIIQSAIEKDKNDDQSQVIYASTGEQISADKIEESLKKGPVTIKDYTNGVLQTFSEDGTLLYETALPIRNTGYRKNLWYLVPLILLAGLLILVVLCIWKPKWKIPWQVYSVIFALIAVIAVVVGGRDTVRAYMQEWQAVWIAGAPEYTYKEDNKQIVAENTDYAVTLHSQYGKLSCVNVELETPLYYGDGDEELDKGVGIYAGSTLPGQTGTTLIGGHDTTYFKQLQDIAVDDVIAIDAVDGTHYYRVTETKVTGASDEEAYQLQDGTDELILYTCYPFGDTSTERSQRFFVYAAAMNSEESER